MYRTLAPVLIALAVAAPSVAWSACGGKSPILADRFDDDLNGWDADKAITIGGKQMVITLPADSDNNRQLNNSFLAKNAEFCLSGVFPKGSDEAAAVGIIFWAQDYRNFFVFQADSRGKASFYRYTNARWIHVFSEDTDAVKREPGAVNQVRVSTKGNLVSTFVNDVKIRDLRTQPPPADSRFGVYTQTSKPVEDADGRTFRLTEYTVSGND